jgi:hypothetical protein
MHPAAQAVQDAPAVQESAARQLPDPGLALPAPSVLAQTLGLAGHDAKKRSSYVEADLMQSGNNFNIALPQNHVAPDGGNAVFTPAFAPGGTIADLGYCTYLFNVSGYDRNNQVRPQWSIAPASVSQCFIGLANWGADRWDWYGCNAVGWADTGPMSAYFNLVHNLLVVVAVEGSNMCVLSGIRLGGLPPVPSVNASPSTGAIPISVHLDASASTTPEGTLTKYEWDFNGDGVFDQDTGATATVDHTYDSGGDINVTVRVSNSLGGSATASTLLQLTGPWTHTLGKNLGDDFEATASDLDGNIYATGYTHESRLTGDVDLLLLTKWSPTGALLWAKTWEGGFLGAYGHDIGVDSDGNVIVAGQIHIDPDVDKALLQKWAPDGTLLWNYEYYDAQRIIFNTLSIDGTDYYVAGMGPRTSGASDVLTMKLDGTGAPQWEAEYETGHADVALDSALRWTFLTGNNELYVLAGSTAIPNRAVLLQYDLDSTLQAAKWYTDSTNSFDPTALQVTQNGFDYTTTIYVAGNLTAGASRGVFLTDCDGFYSILQQVDWLGSADAYAGKLVFGNSSDIFLGGTMAGAVANSAYGMLWRFNTADLNLLSTEYWSDSSQASSFYNLGWYQNGMLLSGVADDASASWSTLSGSSGIPSGAWSDVSGTNTYITLSVGGANGAVADLSGATQDTGAGAADALLMWRALP